MLNLILGFGQQGEQLGQLFIHRNNNTNCHHVCICVYSYFLLLSFAQEVERLEYLFLRGRLVDTYVAYVAQEGEVDMVGRVLLVVLHEGEQCFVVVARDGQLRIMGVDVLHRLA